MAARLSLSLKMSCCSPHPNNLWHKCLKQPSSFLKQTKLLLWKKTGKHLAKQFDIFYVTSQCTSNFNLLLDPLKSIPQMSVESDRSFSTAGLFVKKLRTWLSDHSVDRLCLLKCIRVSIEAISLTLKFIIRFLLNWRSLFHL